jgi:hypothetical protein
VRVLPGLPAKSGAKLGRRRTALLGADRRRRARVLLRQQGHGAAGGAERRPADHHRKRAGGRHPVSQGQDRATAEIPRKVIAGAAKPQRQQGEEGDEDGEDNYYWYDRGTRLQGAVQRLDARPASTR